MYSLKKLGNVLANGNDRILELVKSRLRDAELHYRDRIERGEVNK